MKIKVTKDLCEIKENEIWNVGDYNVHTVQVELSPEFNGLVNKVRYFVEDKSYDMLITDNVAQVPYEATVMEGTIKIGVYGYDADTDILVQSTSPVNKYIASGTYTGEADNTEPLTPTDKQQIESAIQQNIDDIIVLQNNKQDVLISGENIKTINNESILGSGNIEIGGGGGGTSNYNALTNKPKINNVELKGNKSLSDLGIQPAGNYATMNDLTEESRAILNEIETTYYNKNQTNNLLNNKQNTLISGQNIKTINNTSILGSGNIEVGGTSISQWENTIIDFMGDSITEGYPGGTTVTKKYWEFLGEKLNATVHGYGIGGSTLADGYNPMFSRVLNMDSSANLIFVFGGTNDFALQNRVLGEQFTISDGTRTLNVTTSTFYGGLNKLCLNLIENFPNATYVLLTPIHRKNFNGQKTDLQANTAGLYLDDYVEAIKKVGEWFSIPVIDLYSKSSLYPQDQAQKLKYFASDNDGLHPNTLGHEVLANCIYDELSTICKKLSSVSYSITKNVTNGSITGPSTISGSASLTLTANSGYALPSTITVSGAQYTYNNTTGIITLSNPTDNVVITAVCVAVTTYNITKSITNGTASGPNTIAENGTATITVGPNENYYMPDAITVTGATYTYNKTNKTIVLSNPTSDVSITVVCEYRQPTTYTITTNITNGTYSGDSTITNTGTATVTITADNDYNLPTTITVTGAQYTYNNTTGVISLSQATGNVSIKAICYQPVSTWYSDTAIDAFVGSNLSSYRTWANAGGFAAGSVASGSTENPNPPEGSHINRCRFRAGKGVNNTTGGDGSAITGSLIVGKLNTVSKEVTYVETIDLTPYNFTADRSTIREVPIAEFVIGENEVPCFWTSNIKTFSCYHGQDKDVVMSSLWATITMSTSTSTQSANLVNWTGNLCFDFGYYV